MQKKAINIVLLVALGLVVVATLLGTYYYYEKTSDYNFQKSGYEADLGDYNKKIETKKAKLSDLEVNTRSSSTTTTTTTTKEVATGVDTSDWSTFTNSKYGYSFKYPSTYTLGPCTNKPCSSFLDEQQGGDIVLMQGDISVDGWPSVQVVHYDTATYNPPSGSGLNEFVLAQFSFLADYFPSSPNLIIPKKSGSTIMGADMTIPSSPQSYATRYIYYIENDMLFQITMNDPESLDAKEFYDAWLETYKED